MEGGDYTSCKRHRRNRQIMWSSPGPSRDGHDIPPDRLTPACLIDHIKNFHSTDPREADTSCRSEKRQGEPCIIFRTVYGGDPEEAF